jgi:hypothetical protein
MSEPKLKCSERVPSGRFGRIPCSKPVTVERDGHPCCTIHDPERIAARRDAWNRAYDERAIRDNQIYAKTSARAAIATAAIEAVNDAGSHDPWFRVIAAVRKWEKLP